MSRRLILILSLVLTACVPTNPVQPTPTSTLFPQAAESEPSQGTADSASVEKTSSEGYDLQVNFHWTDSNTRTDITYTYYGFFSVLGDGRLEAVADQPGLVEGLAGLKVNDCYETQPVQMTFFYDIQGSKIGVPLEEVDTLVLMANPDLVEEGQVEVFDFRFLNPEIDKFDLAPFTSCLKDLDPEFAQTLLTYWLLLIPDLPASYRRVPVQPGTYCTETINYVEQGLGELSPCYTISPISD
jgi:hypothetical protein